MFALGALVCSTLCLRDLLTAYDNLFQVTCVQAARFNTSDRVMLQVVRKQVAFLLLAFLTLLATTLLPVALTLARHAAAAAASREAAAAKPIVDNNDYTCLGLPWFS